MHKNMRWFRFVISIGVLCALAVAIFYQFIGPYARRARMPVPDFNRYIPKEIPGWLVEDRPIADSPEMLRVVETLLRYDAAIFRVYKKQNIEISVYLAYWLPGKVHPQNIDAHTPDVCWVANGWNMKMLPPLPFVSEKQGPAVPLSNHRAFTVSGNKLEVLYWHINGMEFRQSSSIDEMLLPSRERRERQLRNYWTSLTAGTQEQLFVRLSVNGKMADAISEEPAREVLDLIRSALSGGLRANEI